MKLSLKTTAGRTTEVEFDAANTIADVKESLKDEYDLKSLRLCFQGKILEDGKAVGELGDGAVLFIAGKKAALVKSVQETVSSVPHPTTVPEQPTSSAVQAPTSASAAPAPAPVSAPVSDSAPAPSAVPGPVTDATTARESSGIDESLVEMLVAMGFPDRSLVQLALRAAYMNPDRAVDYLCSGISVSALQRLASEATPAMPVQRSEAPVPQPTAAPEPQSSLRTALQSIPNFDQIRQVVAQNPASLPTFMQQLQQSNPAVFALVEQNPQEFLEILQSAGNTTPTSSGASGGTTRIELTPEDQIAIQELVDIGGGAWDAQAAAIVYIASRKAKEVAAAILFEHGGVPPELMQAILNQHAGAGESEDDDDFSEQ